MNFAQRSVNHASRGPYSFVNVDSKGYRSLPLREKGNKSPSLALPRVETRYSLPCFGCARVFSNAIVSRCFKCEHKFCEACAKSHLCSGLCGASPDKSSACSSNTPLRGAVSTPHPVPRPPSPTDPHLPPPSALDRPPQSASQYTRKGVLYDQHGGYVPIASRPQCQGPWTLALDDRKTQSFVSMQRAAFPPEVLGNWLDRLIAEVPWNRPSNGRRVMPRLTAWYTKAPCRCEYRYSNFTIPPLEFSPLLDEITHRVAALCGIPHSESPNACNVNLYQSGDQAVGMHRDDEPIFGPNTSHVVIVSLSLGARRDFSILPNGSDTVKVSLGHGDVCTMEGQFQRFYKHGVPRSHQVRNPRVNLTWRWVVHHTASCRRYTPSPHPPASSYSPSSCS